MNTKASSFLVGAPMPIPTVDPYPAYHKVRKENPIYRVSPTQWVITGYQDAISLLQNPLCSHWGQDSETQAILFSGKSAVAKTLFAFAPDSGLPYRKNVMHALAGKNLKFDGKAMQEQADQLLDKLVGKEEIDFIRDYAHPLTFETISRIIGIPEEDIPELSETVAELDGMYLGLIYNPVATGAGGLFLSFLRTFIEQKKANPGDDLCSALIDACRREEEDESFILSMLILLFYAGHDNMMNFLGNAILALDKHQPEQAILREQPARAYECVDELLRYDSPVQFFLLFAKGPIPLGTKTIAAGSQILICVGAANRDPSVFTNPDGLDLNRKPAHLSYGTGAYRCIGARLAHMQAGTALSKFIARTTAYAPVNGGTVWRTAPYVQRGPSSVKLHVTWNPAL